MHIQHTYNHSIRFGENKKTKEQIFANVFSRIYNNTKQAMLSADQGLTPSDDKFCRDHATEVAKQSATKK